ncbi:MAG TPA: GNAT family N-acetyltransferase, partial [Casimicrobiaceae bacterium]|nr:GNAT family N-acetyltransferase [Casimicrobiaceae bacterium]
MTADAFEDGWLARIEEAGLNASAPREQRAIDGWLVRLAPGKAKRARSIQPVAPGRLGIDEKLALCLPLFAAAELPPIVRITPFAQPARLDEHLAALGMTRFDDSLVMVLPSLAATADAGTLADDGATLETIDARSF